MFVSIAARRLIASRTVTRVGRTAMRSFVSSPVLCSPDNITVCRPWVVIDLLLASCFGLTHLLVIFHNTYTSIVVVKPLKDREAFMDRAEPV